MLVQLPDVEIVKEDNDDDHEDGDDDDANDQKSPQNLGLELANLLLGATVRLPDHWDDVHLDVNPDDNVHLDVHHQHDVHLHVHPDEDVHSNVHHRDNVHIYKCSS